MSLAGTLGVCISFADAAVKRPYPVGGIRMVQIINMSHHPRVVLPEDVPLDEPMEAVEFLENLCEIYQADRQVLFQKLIILVDGERLKGECLVSDGSKIYILPAATMG